MYFYYDFSQKIPIIGLYARLIQLSNKIAIQLTNSIICMKERGICLREQAIRTPERGIQTPNKVFQLQKRAFQMMVLVFKKFKHY